MALKGFADCHSCLPLHGDCDINLLRLHYESGVRYVSINVGMDMNPLSQIMTTIAGFRRQINKSDFLIQAERYEDIERAFIEDKLAVSFDLEGALALLEQPDMVDLYHHLGVRQIHLAYNRNNSIAGGAHDFPQGLSKLGELVVARIHEQGILMDLSHSGEKTALEICALSKNLGFPVLYSHANPRALCDHGRNISDQVMRAVAQTNGLVAINGVARFLPNQSLEPKGMLDMIDYAVDLLGSDYVAVGLDYAYDDGRSDIPLDVDRNYWWPVEAGYLPGKGLSGRYISPKVFPFLAEGLLKRNYSIEAVNAILRENILKLIKKIWKK